MESRLFGLLGAPLSHSFSKAFFTEFFKKNNLPHKYQLFEFFNLKDFVKQIPELPQLSGFNVTIPYKEQIIPFLDSLSPEAKEVGAVNCVKVKNNKLTGYNTDIFGFEKTLETLKLPSGMALILGTGGAAKAVAYVLKKREIPFLFVSTGNNKQNAVTYMELWEKDIRKFPLIVNATPLGMYPHTEDFPKIPYHRLTPKHILIDLVYNPVKTEFLFRGEKQGTTIVNGMVMLENQALKSWEIWDER